MDFYQGKVLRLDLSAGASTVEPLNMEWAERYIGGKGLLLRYMWDEVPRNVDPWAPENPVILMTGPFAGTNVSTASRLVVGCKSPQTGILNDSYVGGSFAPELKFAGYDVVIITGESPEPVVVVIKDDVVEFRAGEAQVLGPQRPPRSKRRCARTSIPNVKTLSIGPAGENQLLWACLSTDQYHKAGRGGHGALWGRKNLKAIAVRGTGTVTVGDAKAFLDDMYRIHSEFVLTEDNLWANEEGTPVLAQIMSDAGVMPTRNWSSGSFDGVEGINSDSFLKIRTKNRACYQCAIGCRQFHETDGIAGEGPEYETIALCGGNCGIGDIAALMKFNELCDQLGMDTISTGSVVGLAMDLTEKGIKDFGMRFGETEGYLKAPDLICAKEGVGAELALGSRGLAAKYGVPELAMEVKNMELPGYDPRGSFGMSLGYATSDRGGCHMRAYPIADEIVGGTLPPDSLEGKALKVVWGNPAEGMIGENFSAVKFTGIWCDFWAVTPEQIAQIFKHAWKHEFTEDEVFQIGERVWNLGRLFNLREGVEPDDIPHKLYMEEGAHTTGASAGRAIGTETFKNALQEFYQIRGWDERGVPSEAKLAEIGVDVRL